MLIHQSVYERISNSLSLSVCIFDGTRSRCRHCYFAFACAGARSLYLRRAVATASSSRGSTGAGRSPNSIRSGLRDRTAAASGNLYRRALTVRHGNLGGLSFTK